MDQDEERELAETLEALKRYDPETAAGVHRDSCDEAASRTAPCAVGHDGPEPPD